MKFRRWTSVHVKYWILHGLTSISATRVHCRTSQAKFTSVSKGLVAKVILAFYWLCIDYRRYLYDYQDRLLKVFCEVRKILYRMVTHSRTDPRSLRLSCACVKLRGCHLIKGASLKYIFVNAYQPKYFDVNIVWSAVYKWIKIYVYFSSELRTLCFLFINQSASVYWWVLGRNRCFGTNITSLIFYLHAVWNT